MFLGQKKQNSNKPALNHKDGDVSSEKAQKNPQCSNWLSVVDASEPETWFSINVDVARCLLLSTQPLLANMFNAWSVKGDMLILPNKNFILCYLLSEWKFHVSEESGKDYTFL